MEQVNPWTQVVSLLAHIASADWLGEQPWSADCQARMAIQEAAPRDPHQAMPQPGRASKVTSIERQENASVLVSWCDPTMCHYVDQVWRRVTARNAGYCALTGQPIKRGDAIFKPRARGRNRPVNYDEMILASALA
ncbi:DUF3331 domain-containing protein [Paraburkholderia sp.]|uniref:DUF3331 domain-containing protein n=1 Tax=Paraburkholderia sp. TaxID=1926495 RepID=UPI003C720322